MGSRGTRGARRRGRSPLRYVPVALGVVALLAGAAWVGVKWADSTRDDPSHREAVRLLQQAAAPGADWRDVLAELYRRQAAAFAAGDHGALATVYAPESPSLAADVGNLRQYVAEGARVRSFGLVVESAEVREATSGRVMLEVVDRLPGYDVLDSLGKVVQRFPPRGPARFEITLVPAADPAGEWRILRIELISGPATTAPATSAVPPA